MAEKIRKRFNPDTLDNEDSSSSSHSTAHLVQSTTRSNLPTSTTDGSPVSRRRSALPFRHKKLVYRRQRLREFKDYHRRSLKELLQLRLMVNDGLNRIGDILERLVKSADNNNTIAMNLAEAATQITMTATNLTEVFAKSDINFRY